MAPHTQRQSSILVVVTRSLPASPSHLHHCALLALQCQSVTQFIHSPTLYEARYVPTIGRLFRVAIFLLPNHNAEPVPALIMKRSKAPVYGHLPNHAHRRFRLQPLPKETMQWAHPETMGDVPLHVVHPRIFMFGGGEGPTYYNHLFVLGTVMCNWTRSAVRPTSPSPSPATLDPRR